VTLTIVRNKKKCDGDHRACIGGRFWPGMSSRLHGLIWLVWLKMSELL
jgi:hypothetical protein